MSKLSIRELPQDLDQAIRNEAQKLGTTKTEIVLEALRAFFSPEKKSSRVRRNVRSFFGKMTREEYGEFRKAIAEFSAIDEALWK